MECGVINTAGNIRIYRPQVFRMTYGLNQLYSMEYDCGVYFSIFRVEGEGKDIESK